MKSNGTNRWLRGLGIVLLALTVLITLLGAIGTTCVAFGAEKWGPRMAALIPVKPIFQLLVVLSLAAGILGLVATVGLARRRAGAYRLALIFLVVGLLTSGVQMYFSATLRGSTAPNNFRVYLTALTLIILLALRLPGLWERTGFGGSAAGSGAGAGAGVALAITGLVTLTTPIWAGSTHMIDSVNTVEVLLWPLMVTGAGLLLGGLAALAWPRTSRLAPPLAGPVANNMKRSAPLR
jgi:hypothetical protein